MCADCTAERMQQKSCRGVARERRALRLPRAVDATGHRNECVKYKIVVLGAQKVLNY